MAGSSGRQPWRGFRDSAEWRRLAEVVKLASGPARLGMLAALRDGERCVGDLAAAVGRNVSTTSRHLALLRRVGFVAGRRDGHRVCYALTVAGWELLRAVDGIGG
jgi:DNA-binding transcriptional ArsR family regulator